MKLTLLLGCWGRTEERFCSCKGIENEILDLSRPLEVNLQICDYLDTFKMFDKPLYTNIHTIIFNIQNNFSDVNKAIFKENVYKQIEEFCINHKKCGLYLRLELKEVGE